MLPLRVIVNLAVVASLTTPVLPAQRAATLQDSVSTSRGRVIVTLKSGQSGAAARLQGEPPVSLAEQATIRARLFQDIGLRPRGTAPAIAAVFATVTDEQLVALMDDPNVDLVEPDVLVTLAGDRSMASIGSVWGARAEPTPWGVGRVGAPQAWAAGNTGVGARIGIIDSGIENNHPDLSIGGGFDFVTGSASSSAWDDNIAVCNGHGTHVAGITAALQNNQQVIGVAPGATVFALKVFEVVSGSCSSWSSNQIAAINWAITNQLDVVNFSLASATGLTAYQNAIDAATAAGVVVVAATGNNGASSVTYPARYNNVIAVAALDGNNNRASFSNAGPEVWLAAPGVNIVSTMPGATTGSKSGTSMAAPHVAGLVALMRAANPSWSVARIRDELRIGALDAGAVGFDQETGFGLAQAFTGSVAPVVTISVSPPTRSVTVVAGNAGPAGLATVTVTGGSASWVASKRKSWTTLTTSAGTGSGPVQWSRNVAGLAPGVYVDTIAVTAAGAVGSPATVFDTVRITAAGVPLTIAVAPTGRSTTVPAGGTATGDSATVTLAGTGSSSVPWSATKRSAWLSLTAPSGTGSGTVRWTRNAAGLTAGTYVDTITVNASGTSGSRVVYDTLRITAVVVPLTIQVAPAGRSNSVQAGGTAAGDSATVTIAGTGSSSVAWSATKRSAWVNFTSPSGTGSGTVRWNRNASGLSVGTYVDTITVNAAGTTGARVVYDTLRITAAPVPITVQLTSTGRSTTVQVGGTASGDSIAVTIAGTGSGAVFWEGNKTSAWLVFTSRTGTGSGMMRWNRNATGLAAGTYVDTIMVHVPAISAQLYVHDTLRVVAGAVPLAVGVTPASSRTVMAQGSSAPNGSGVVTVSGTGGATAAWTVSRKQSWTTLLTAAGTGSGSISWQRNTAGLSAGTYVDTITVALASGGATARIIDSLVVNGVQPLVATLSPLTRSRTVVRGSAPYAESMSVNLSGTGASSATWTSTNRRSWNQLTTATGVGSGTLRWTRTVGSLTAGVYVDTISVSVTGLATMFAIDSTIIREAEVALTVTPAGRNKKIKKGFGHATTTALDSAQVDVLGAVAGPSTWLASTSASWITILTPSGDAPGSLLWDIDATALATGVHVDSIVIVLASDPTVRTVVLNTAEVSEVIAPTPEIAAEDLFSGGRLDSGQRDALDQGGNQNGRYDIGDFLAWVNRAGIRLSGALMDKVAALQVAAPSAAPGTPVDGKP